ncbi:MAG TPA: carboxylating nicotinate-nucleotide diphosphorylase [Candidatus Eremiobacteraceae bacterium]|nr:carboxylating nicotinate-nucleotide diphosphorylase [Candidatus Eremiobacteraceae bacterium]
MTATDAAAFDPLLRAAIQEDVGGGDITTESVVPESATATADVMIRASGVLAGVAVALRTFTLLDSRIQSEVNLEDGSNVLANSAVARVVGPARGILTAERVALNLLGRLSGIATITRSYVDETRGFPAKIADTRKTTPGLRALERYAVRAGGGVNHRFGLHDAMLIKDNHLAAVGGVAEAIVGARAASNESSVVEVECDSLGQVREALEAGADAILLDNMDEATIAKAVKLAKGRAITEASGNVNLRTVRGIASTGVDVISAGALTHGAVSLDVALDFVLQ